MVCKTGKKPRVISILTPSLAMTPVYTLLPAWACFKFQRTLFRKSRDDFRRISEFFKAFRMGLISLSLLKPFRKDVLTYYGGKVIFFIFLIFFIHYLEDQYFAHFGPLVAPQVAPHCTLHPSTYPHVFGNCQKRSFITRL